MIIKKGDTFDIDLAPYSEIKLGNNLIFSETYENCPN